jgi:ABC-type transport system substrate-binding protein
LPANQGVFNPTYDPSKLKSLVGGLRDKHVDLAYTTDDPVNAQVAELVAQDLDAAGLQVTTRGVTEAVTFAWPTKPTGRSNMLILPANPDDADASAWASLFYETGGGLSYFAPGVTAADNLINAGLSAVNPKTIQSDYASAANIYRQSGDFVPLADEKAVMVADSNITGFSVDFSTLWTDRLWDLRAK